MRRARDLVAKDTALIENQLDYPSTIYTITLYTNK